MSELPPRTQTSVSLKIASGSHKTPKTLSDWFTYVYSEVPDFGTTHKICKILRVELDEENLVVLCEFEKPVPVGVLLRAAQIKPTQTVAAKAICDTVYMSDLLLSEKINSVLYRFHCHNPISSVANLNHAVCGSDSNAFSVDHTLVC
jgi:hypothetical protein